MTTKPLSLDVVTYNTLMTMSQGAPRWMAVLALFRSMRKQGLQAEEVAFNSLLAACGSSKQWQESLSIVMDRGSFQPSVVTISMALNMCGEVKLWQCSHHLLELLQKDHLEPWKSYRT